jgi:hypothetical protein
VLDVNGVPSSITPTGTGPYTFTWNTVGVADGRYTLTVLATDTANATGTSTPVQVTVDRTGPVVFFTAPSAGAWATNSLHASVDASDSFGASTVQFNIDTNAPVDATAVGQIFSADLPLAGISDGVHTLTATATDSNHNVTTTNVTFNVGIQPLSASITSPGSGFATTDKQIAVNAVGGVGPYSYQLVVNGTDTGSPTSSSPLTWSIAGLAEAQYQIDVRVTDSNPAGATTVTTQTITETVDNSPPQVFWITPADNDRDNGPTKFTVHASDSWGIGSVQFTIDGVNAGAPVTTPDGAPGSGLEFQYSATIDTSSAGLGTRHVSAIVTDNAGRTANAPDKPISTGPITYLPVLNYHGIEDSGNPDVYEVTTDNAKAQLAWLQANGYHSVTLEQYQQWLNGQDIGVDKPVLITVDDGLTDQLAWDGLLQTYGFKAVMFVVTGFADNSTPGDTGSQNLTWTQLQQLAADGRWEMAFHAGQFGHGDSYSAGSTVNGVAYSSACPYFYSCLGNGQTEAQYEAAVTAEVQAGVDELHQKIPTASSIAWAAPFNDAGQWTNLYNNDATQAFLPQFLQSKFAITFTQTSPVDFGGASGTVGALDGFGRHFRFEVDRTTDLPTFTAALTKQDFRR